MLINSVSKAVFEGNGIATDFPFAFKVWAESQLLVQVTTPQGETRQVTDFTATLTEEGGTVTYIYEGAPLPKGYMLVILRQMPFAQEVDLINGTRFDPEVIEDALDKATAERQELREAVARSVKLDASSFDTPENLIQELRDNTALAVSSAEISAQSATASFKSSEDAASSASSAQKSAEDAATFASEAGEAAGEAAMARVEAEGDKQVSRVQTEGDKALSSMAELVNVAFLPGMVVAFTGAFGGPDNKHPIPTGATEPDLTWQLHEPSRGKFILGGDGTNTGALGGSTVTDGHTLTTGEMPQHSHTTSVSRGDPSNGSGTGVSGRIIAWDTIELATGPAGRTQPHSHGQSLPPYYTLAYIEKLYVDTPSVESIFVTKAELEAAVEAVVPDTLPNPHALTINGTPYDGSKAVEMIIQGGGGGSYDDTAIKQEISDVQRQLVYATPTEKGMVRISEENDAVQIHLIGADDSVSVSNFPLKDKPIRVLSIGNSFSEDMHQWIGHIINTTGNTDFVFGNASIGGASLETHATYVDSSAEVYYYQERTSTALSPSSVLKSLLEVVQAQDWDVVTLQQVSSSSGLYDTITPYLQTLINFIKENCSNTDVKVIYHTTWAYASDSTHSGFPNYDSDQMTMYKALSSTAKQILGNYPDVYGLIPSNTVVQNARSVPALNAIGDELTRDGFHIDYEEGRTLLGLGMVQSLLYPLYGVSIDDVVYSALPSEITTQLSQAEYDLMIPCVKNAFTHPFDISGAYANSYNLQRALVSGGNIKTINNQSLLGSGNIAISGSGGAIPSVIEDLVSASISVSIVGNTVYKYGELTALDITAQDASYVASFVYFSSGATPTVVTYPDDAGYIPSVVTIEANTSYIMRVQGGYFELLKRTPASIPVPSEYTEYTDYTVVLGFCLEWSSAGLTQVVSTSATTEDNIKYVSSPSVPSSISSVGMGLSSKFLTSKRPLFVPSGTKIEVIDATSITRHCAGTSLTNGTREGVTITGLRTIAIEEDCYIMFNTSRGTDTYESDPDVLRDMLDARIKILVPTAKLAQAKNNEV